MKFLYVAAAILLMCTSSVHAQSNDELFQRNFLVIDNDTLPYRIMYPENYDPTKAYPVVFFLHGAGERGDDNDKQLYHGSKLFANATNRTKFPAIVVAPQCSKDSYWSNVARVQVGKDRSFVFRQDGAATTSMNLVQTLVHFILDSVYVDKSRVYVGGLSMGGMGTFELVRRMPNTFAAAFPICGGANPATVSSLTTRNWWVFHGGKDDVVKPIYSQRMVDALTAQGNNVQFTLYPYANHNSWDSAFAEPNLLPWLFSQQLN